MRHIGSLAMFFAIAIFFAGALPAQEKKIEMTMVKYDGLKQEILKHRGKVVIVDFWATNCPPCILALPHYVELQKKFADKGLVVITVSVDPVDNKERVSRANSILTKKEVNLRNLILDEPPETWSKRFGGDSLPFAYLFDRSGKWVRYRGSETPDYDQAVEKTLMQMLNEK